MHKRIILPKKLHYNWMQNKKVHILEFGFSEFISEPARERGNPSHTISSQCIVSESQ